MDNINSTFLQPSFIELDTSALKQNLEFLRSKTKKDLKISSVIKGNAYGHGIRDFLPIAENAGIDRFFVFSANEAELACKYKQKQETKIAIMGMIRDEELEWAINQGVEFYLFDMERFEAAIKSAKKSGIKAKVHLQLETGMNRTGFMDTELKRLVQLLADNSGHIDPIGICTHYAGAESVANYFRIQNQDKKFREMSGLIERKLKRKIIKHACSSAAFLTYPEMHYDMVRLGIAQYGFWPSRETYMHHIKSEEIRVDEDPLKRVLAWKSEVMSLQKVESGEFIGYGNVYLAGKDMLIATVPIGYTHGFGRNLTNTGYVLINGVRCGVVGIVNMNMITVNVTHLSQIKRGDEVVLIGKQGDDEITVASFGEMTNHLNYEVLTRIPSTIPRIVF